MTWLPQPCGDDVTTKELKDSTRQRHVAYLYTWSCWDIPTPSIPMCAAAEKTFDIVKDGFAKYKGSTSAIAQKAFLDDLLPFKHRFHYHKQRRIGFHTVESWLHGLAGG